VLEISDFMKSRTIVAARALEGLYIKVADKAETEFFFSSSQALIAKKTGRSATC
jgi:hypothetical protein